MKPGIYDLTAEQYHAEPAETPSLTASIAHVLCTRSPRHAWTNHPVLNPNYERRVEDKFDRGIAAHEWLLRGEDIVAALDYPNWRTAEAQEQRDAARAAGMVPLLSSQWYEVKAMVDLVRLQLADHGAEPPLFTDGQPEQTLVWKEDGVLCRARLDWLRDDFRTIDDLKTTSRSAHPEVYSRRLYDVGGDVQAAFYIRGLRVLRNQDPEFRWVVVETKPPYALSVLTPGPAVLNLANRKIDHALAVWKRCLESNEWPGYDDRVATAELPVWEEARWLDREAMEEEAAA